MQSAEAYDPYHGQTTINERTEKAVDIGRHRNEEEVNINLLDAEITGENA